MVKKRVSKKIIGIVKRYRQRLEREEKIPIERVIIFGSQVNGKTHKWSDIDVCILSPKFKEPLEALRFLLHKRNRREVLSGLEPVGFTREDFEEGGTLIQEIKKTGLELK